MTTSRSTRPLVELSDVSVRREGSLLLGGVTWAVEPGQRWVVLGSNGAGKTTLLRLAAGLDLPSEGTVRLLGQRLDADDPDLLEELRPRVGLASAAVADVVRPGERVLDLVASAAYDRLGRGAVELDAYDLRRARRLLVEVGCRPLLDRPWATLSEGERKRVLVARALMTDPELLLMDEPAAGLDLGAREALLRRLARLAADPDGPALVLVTHVLEEVPAGFTHALLLRRGTVVGAGPVAEVLTAPMLSTCFGFPLVVSAAEGRFSARAAVGAPPARHAAR